ncbi:MAG TPA: alpha/beta fold hydrolase [Anaerolineales bacterium]|nr:alpha/beta fold hydrolase [Anaerolineales bacterium]
MKITLPEFTIAYEDQGSGLPILFIHGFPLNRRMWAPQIEQLSGAGRVLAPDLRGHGETLPTPAPYSMDMLADDCAAFLEATGVTQPVVVCGLSMGGYITLAFYRRHRPLVAGLVLAATRAGADTPEGRANRDKAAGQVRELGIRAVVDSMLPKMMAPITYASNPELVARVEEIMADTSQEGMVAALLGMKERPDSTPMLEQIDAPTLIVHGLDDQLIPVKEAEVMHAAIKNSQLHLLQDAGHLLNLEQPALFNQVMGDFLESF